MKYRNLLILFFVILAIIIFSSLSIKKEGFETIQSDTPPECGKDGVLALAVKDNKPYWACILKNTTGTTMIDSIFSDPKTSFIRILNPNGYTTTLYDSSKMVIAKLPLEDKKAQIPNIYEGNACVKFIKKENINSPQMQNSNISTSTGNVQKSNSNTNKESGTVQPMGVSSTSQNMKPTLEQCSKFFKCQLTMSPI